MEVIIRPTADAAIALSAALIKDAVIKNPKINLGLATGRTMERLYDQLVRYHKDEGLDFSLCTSFNLDEYVGLDSEDKNSYRFYMNQFLFSKINIDIRNTHLPNGMANDLDSEGERYEKVIDSVGGIDIQLLGIGRTGHIGFNEPLSALRSRTREKALTEETMEQNRPLFDNPDDMPHRAMTMGVGTILDARRIYMLATGVEKAEILAKAVEGPITSMISASALQMHPHCTVIVDEEAASKLEGQDYYRWIFNNEPEWQPYKCF